MAIYDRIPEIPQDCPSNLRPVLTAMRNRLEKLVPSVIPPGPVTNLTVTPMDRANRIQFTRSDGSSYVLVYNTAPSLNLATLVELGNTNDWVDTIGRVTYQRWYAVYAKKGQLQSILSEWKNGTTLAVGTNNLPPTPPPASQNVTESNETEAVVGFEPSAGMNTENLL